MMSSFFMVVNECLRDAGYIRCGVNIELVLYVVSFEYRGCGLMWTVTESSKRKHRVQPIDSASKNCEKISIFRLP